MVRRGKICATNASRSGRLSILYAAMVRLRVGNEPARKGDINSRRDQPHRWMVGTDEKRTQTMSVKRVTIKERITVERERVYEVSSAWSDDDIRVHVRTHHMNDEDLIQSKVDLQEEAILEQELVSLDIDDEHSASSSERCDNIHVLF